MIPLPSACGCVQCSRLSNLQVIIVEKKKKKGMQQLFNLFSFCFSSKKLVNNTCRLHWSLGGKGGSVEENK